MLDVAVWSAWRIGRSTFTTWYAAASVVGNFVFVRIATRLSLGRAIAADLAMTGVCLLFIAAIPVPLLAYVAAEEGFLGGRSNPIGWIIAALLSAFTSTLICSATLVVFRQRVTRRALCLLLAVNLVSVAIALYRMAVFVLAHPPEA
jgi:hypothetical protein